MVTPAKKLDSNTVGLSFAEETSIGVVAGGAEWYGLDPNSFADFGGSIKTMARRPISPSRQRKKGVTVDFDASGGFGIDLTQTNLQRLLQGFFFADLRVKAELSITNVKQAGIEEDYEPAAGGDGFFANDLLFAKGFAVAGNNGLKLVVSGAATSVVSTTALTAEVVPAPRGTISRVGHQFATADARIDSSGTYPKMTTEIAGKDLTKLGVLPGEWIYIGGDTAVMTFATAADNGWARIRSVAAHYLEFDKTSGTMVNDNGAAKTIQIFCGRVLKNEVGTAIVRRTYQLERTLGAPDEDQPTQIQSEYVIGAVPNELTINVPIADKITADLSFVGIDVEQRTGVTGVKTGTHNAVAEADAFNTSSDFARVRMSVVGTATALFAYFTELKLTIKNNVSPNKSVGVLGSFEVTAGIFEISGSLTAYLADLAATAAVRSNSDITLDIVLAKANTGIAIDFPIISLGDARAKVELDKAIMLPLTMDMGTGAKILATQDHTVLMSFFDYLPTVAC